MRNVKRAHQFLLWILIIGVFGARILSAFLQERVFDLASQYILLFIPVCIVIFIRKKNPKEILLLNKIKVKSLFWIVILSFLMQPLILFLSNLGMALFGDPNQLLFGDVSRFSFGESIFILAFTPAICEELVFRGIIADYYKRMNFIKAGVMSGVLFGLYHMNPYQFMYTFFIGFFAYIVLRFTKSIIAPIILHMLNNTITICADHFSDVWFPSLQKILGNYQNATSWIFFSLMALLSLVLSFYCLVKILKQNNSEFEENTSEGRNEKIFDVRLLIIIIMFLISSVVFIDAIK